MPGRSDDLGKLLELVADGESVDWDEFAKAAPDEESRNLLRQLRLVAEVAEVHRSAVDRVVLAEDVIATATPLPAGAHWPVPKEHEGQRRIWPQVGETPSRDRGGSVPAASLGVWGHLLLVRKIGEGSFGEVYQAHDTWLDHPVALKLLKREAESRVPPSQLLHEARKLARVRHSNVVTVHGADRHNGRVGFWMDFVDGETLATRVSRGRLSAGEALGVGQETCRALAAVHRANIIHRDVKAQNVMRAHDGGRIILMDFGAGQFVDDPTLVGRPQGTPLYLAPELLRGSDASVQSDVYAVGVLLYHLVTGRFPVEGASQAALAEAHARGERRRLRDERPDLPESFIATVERALDPDPERRYTSAGEMEARLAGGSRSTTATLPASLPAAPTLGDYVKRAAAVAAGAVGLAGVLGFIATRAFETALQIEPDFYLGVGGVFSVGAQALLPFVAFWVVCAAVAGVVSALRLLLPHRVAATVRQRLSVLRTVNPAVMATVIFVAGALAWVALTWWYADIVSALWALRQNPEGSMGAQPSGAGPPWEVLSQANRDHAWYGGHSTVLSFLLGLAAWRWFPRLEARVDDPSTLRLMKVGTLAVAFLTVALPVITRRAVWENYSVAVYDSRPTLVLGGTAQELLLYASDEAGRPHFRVRRDDPRLRLTGETRALFDRSRSSP